MVRAAMRGLTLAAVVLATACSGDDDGAGNGIDPFANAPLNGDKAGKGGGDTAGNPALNGVVQMPATFTPGPVTGPAERPF